MKWLELIEIRITGKDHDLVESYLKQLVVEIARDKKQKMKVFHKLNLDTDFSIHLVHDADDIEQSGSTLGLNLVGVLKEYGLVNHNIWFEMKTK